MNMQEIVVIAGRHGVTAGNMNKMELIRSIQRAEGYTDCFMTNAQSCSQTNCLWREDCAQKVQASPAATSAAVVEASSAQPAKKARTRVSSASDAPNKTKAPVKKKK